MSIILNQDCIDKTGPSAIDNSRGMISGEDENKRKDI
jgi:hypothetical protein